MTDGRVQLIVISQTDWPEIMRFAQGYMTKAHPGVVKAWNYHLKKTDHFVCVSGMLKLVLYDGRKNSKTFRAVNEFFMGEHQPVLVRIPTRVYHGFKCIGLKECVLINMPTEPYDYKKPDEFRLPAHTRKIPYDWGKVDG